MKRRGSALLVVLGVLSFLVVSAVSFAAFMRRSRLPSSYLRRTVAARQLAKAAVVRATDQIDAAIANGVHPGIGGNRANTWKDRVFYNGSGDQPMRLTAYTKPQDCGQLTVCLPIRQEAAWMKTCLMQF